MRLCNGSFREVACDQKRTSLTWFLQNAPALCTLAFEARTTSERLMSIDHSKHDCCTVYHSNMASSIHHAVCGRGAHVRGVLEGICNTMLVPRAFHQCGSQCWPGISQEHGGVNSHPGNLRPGQISQTCITQVAISPVLGLCCSLWFSVAHSGAQRESLLGAFSLGKTLTDCLLICTGDERGKKEQ